MTSSDSPGRDQEDRASRDSCSQVQVQEKTESSYRLPYLSEHNPKSRLTRAAIAFIPLYVLCLYGSWMAIDSILTLHGGAGSAFSAYVIMYVTTGLLLASQAWYLIAKPLYLEHRNSDEVTRALVTAFTITLPMVFVFTPLLELWPLIDFSNVTLFDTTTDTGWAPGIWSWVGVYPVLLLGWLYGIVLFAKTVKHHLTPSKCTEKSK